MTAASKNHTIAFLLLILLPFFAKAEIRLPYFFSDNMVLQQKTDAAIWGWAKPGSTVQISHFME